MQFQEAFTAAFAGTEEEHQDQVEERAAVAAHFALLTGADIGRTIRDFSAVPHTLEVNLLPILRMIAISHSMAAIEPLVERLKADVI